MNKQKNEFIFSLVFFFFSSFFFLSLISSLFINNFDDLLDIMLHLNNIFIQLLRFLLFVFICILIYLIKMNKMEDSKQYIAALFFVICIFLLFIIVWYVPDYNNLDRILNIYSVDNGYIIANIIKILLVDSFVFVYFITIPLLSFFFKKVISNNFFYKLYTKIAPSLNVSIIFLFGYCVKVYNFHDIFSVIDFILSLISIILFIKIIFSFKNAITFHNIINLSILIFGFILVVFCSSKFGNSNLYYTSLFFYTIGLLYWFFDILAEYH